MKKIRSLVCGALAVTILSSSALAGLTTVKMKDSGTSKYNWDPTLTEVRIDNDMHEAIRMVSYFKWTSTTNFPKYSDGFYYTHEHYDHNDSGNASLNDMYSNLPYASFDRDDDFSSPTAGKEELEVTCANKTSSTPIYANATYFFDTTWRDPYHGRGMLGSVRSQLSKYSLGEYNEYRTEYKGDIDRAYGYGRALYSYADKAEVDEVRSEAELVERQTHIENEEKIMVVHDFFEKSAVDNIEATQIEALHAASTAEEMDLMDNAKVVLTFTQPISSTALDRVLSDADAALDYCVIRYEDNEGKRITGWTDDVSEENLTAKLEHLNVMHENVTYSGIVSATIAVDLTEENYAALSESNCVYFVDLSDTVVRLEQQDYERELNVQIWDLSWDLEFMD